jgi:short-chain fatty acids transporter
VLPAPFTIAVVLTVVTFVLGLTITEGSGQEAHILELMGYWETGLWNPPLLVFAMQMMLILVLGHTIALSPVFTKSIAFLLKLCTDTPRSAFVVSFFTIIVSFFNWGLALVFGAIFARKVGEHAAARSMKLNYGLIGAAGYSGLMMWHGGLSGSAPLKVAESGHLSSLMSTVSGFDITSLPDRIGLDQTVYTSSNLLLFAFLTLVIPSTLFLLGRRNTGSQVPVFASRESLEMPREVKGADRLDHAKWPGIIIGGLLLLYLAYRIFKVPEGSGFATPNNINLVLFAMTLLFHGSFRNFLNAVDEAVGGASGILIQFPLYFGIMGIMSGSGMVEQMATSIASNASASTYPFFTFVSAGLVNVFVPSGGGQWAIQGPIIIQASEQLGLSLPNSIMAMAYGDQLTNMLQPFWALPLLGITGLKPKDILPWSIVIMGIGFVVFGLTLLLF